MRGKLIALLHTEIQRHVEDFGYFNDNSFAEDMSVTVDGDLHLDTLADRILELVGEYRPAA